VDLLSEGMNDTSSLVTRLKIRNDTLADFFTQPKRRKWIQAKLFAAIIAHNFIIY